MFFIITLSCNNVSMTLFVKGGVATRVEFEPCVHAVKNEPCEMTCRIPDFTQLIEFQCNGSSRGLCSVFFCSPNMIRNGSNAVHFQIPSMSYTADNCEWSCTHGTTTSSLISFTIYSKNSRKDQIKTWQCLSKC